MADMRVGKGGGAHFPPERSRPEISGELQSSVDHTDRAAKELVLARFDGKPLGGRTTKDAPPVADKVHNLLI